MIVLAITIQMIIRSSHQRCSVRKRVLGNFAKFTGKHLIFIWRPVHYSFLKVLFDDRNWYRKVIFYHCKFRTRNRKNFAIDRSKFAFHYLIISVLQRFVSSSNCKEKLVALNWTVLVSNFSKFIWSRSSRPEVFCWKGVLKKFSKFMRKQLCRNLLF